MPLLEREGEVERLAAAIAVARDDGRGAVVVVEGAAGLGKTALLRHAGSLASGLRVLSASGSELEHEFGFGIVSQLFERAPGTDLIATLEVHGDRFAALHGLYWLAANLAAEQPLLLAVDDAQWADEPSLRFLAYLARRVEELPIVVLIAVRPPLPGEDRTILDTIAAAATMLAPAPLSETAIATLAGRDADPAFVSAVHTATAGNALLVRELLATSDGSLGLRASEPSLARRVTLRLSGLGAAGPALAAAVAVLGDGAELAVAARLAGVGEEAARAAAAELVAADLFEDDPLLRFRHPLIRAAVAERLPAVERGDAHRRAARLLAERGRPRASSPRTCWRRRPLATRGPWRHCARPRSKPASRARRSSPRRTCAERSTRPRRTARPVSRSSSSSGGPSMPPGPRARPGRLREAWEAAATRRSRPSWGRCSPSRPAGPRGRRSCARRWRARRPRARAAAARTRRGLRADGPVDRRRRARGAPGVREDARR